MAGDPLRFVLNGEPLTVDGVPPTTTLLNWLRYERGLTGTKEGCAEGDCGACTVAIRDRDHHGRLRTRAVNACIQLLPMVHGCEVITVEGISQATAPCTRCNRPWLQGHASQCGFCTPGFVMSLWVAGANGRRPGCRRRPRHDQRPARRQSVPLHRVRADHRGRRPRVGSCRKPDWQREDAAAAPARLDDSGHGRPAPRLHRRRPTVHRTGEPGRPG